MEKKQKILIVGSGGREHAIGWKIKQSKKLTELYFAPGNAGTAQIGTNLPILTGDIPSLLNFAQKEQINLTLALPDDPLAQGIVDEFKNRGLKIWGPSRAAAELEWSKVFSKNFMRENNLPTAKFETFTEYQKAEEYVLKQPLPIVIKASGLALGKGVVIAKTLEEAKGVLKKMMVDKIFGNAGNEVVIEEFLIGTEISIHVFSDGKNYKMFPPSQDHKKIGEEDTGLNTGGMGTVSPLPFVDEKLLKIIEETIVIPTLSALAGAGRPFVGILYPGLMLTKDGPKILEYNARFGDPETQTYIRLLETDLLDIIYASLEGRLGGMEIKWKNISACNIVLASKGYPGEYEKGKIISGIEEAEENNNVIVFHAGTKLDETGNLVTNGGRVLGVSATGADLKEALKTAYGAVSKINFEGMQYRKDIGKRALTMLE